MLPLPAPQILQSTQDLLMTTRVAKQSSEGTAMSCSILVCGGGIGGLTAAIALHKAGAKVIVFESVAAVQTLRPRARCRDRSRGARPALTLCTSLFAGRHL